MQYVSTKIQIYIGTEVPTAVVMKSSIFWDITLCSLLKVNLRFGGMCHLHLQGGRIIQERDGISHPLHVGFYNWLILLPWIWRKYVLPKRLLTFNGLQGVMSQKTELFSMLVDQFQMCKSFSILSSEIWLLFLMAVTDLSL
jgi:hypothetical protein